MTWAIPVPATQALSIVSTSETIRREGETAGTTSGPRRNSHSIVLVECNELIFLRKKFPRPENFRRLSRQIRMALDFKEEFAAREISRFQGLSTSARPFPVFILRNDTYGHSRKTTVSIARSDLIEHAYRISYLYGEKEHTFLS